MSSTASICSPITSISSFSIPFKPADSTPTIYIHTYIFLVVLELKGKNQLSYHLIPASFCTFLAKIYEIIYIYRLIINCIWTLSFVALPDTPTTICKALERHLLLSSTPQNPQPNHFFWSFIVTLTIIFCYNFTQKVIQIKFFCKAKIIQYEIKGTSRL